MTTEATKPYSILGVAGDDPEAQGRELARVVGKIEAEQRAYRVARAADDERLHELDEEREAILQRMASSRERFERDTEFRRWHLARYIRDSGVFDNRKKNSLEVGPATIGRRTVKAHIEVGKDDVLLTAVFPECVVTEEVQKLDRRAIKNRLEVRAGAIVDNLTGELVEDKKVAWLEDERVDCYIELGGERLPLPNDEHGEENNNDGVHV